MSLSSCSNTPAMCDIIEPITVSKDDKLTKQTEVNIVRTNLIIERVCD